MPHAARAEVVVLRTRPETVVADYGRLLERAGFFAGPGTNPEKGPRARPGAAVVPASAELIVKLNLSWTRYYPACSTAPWQLDGVLDALLAHGFRPERVLAVENRTVVTDPEKGARRNGWDRVLARHGVAFRPLTREKWTPYRPKAKLLVLDRIFPEGFEIPELFLGRPILHLPTLKTHGHSVTTGAVKNAFGGLLKEVRHFCHAHIHETLADLMTIQREIHPAVWAAMDGTACGNLAGPRTMLPVVKNLLLASSDSVALDATAARFMGFDPLAVPYLRLCHEMGLGVADPAQIEVVPEGLTADEARAMNFGFRSTRSFVIWGDQVIRKGALRPAEGLLLRTPLSFWAPLASTLYHDWFWYPLVGGGRVRRFMKTEWGPALRGYLGKPDARA